MSQWLPLEHLSFKLLTANLVCFGLVLVVSIGFVSQVLLQLGN